MVSAASEKSHAMTVSASNPAALIVMGVSGSGKSTVGLLLAEALGFEYRDGDSFHPPANVEKMRAGTPLTDEDRWPWLAAIAAWINAHRLEGTTGIVACSALRRVYRDRLRDGHGDVRFLFLQGDKALIGRRLATRKGHYMPASLLDSQFATLEEPGSDEGAVRLSIVAAPEDIAREAIDMLGLEASVHD
jgi:gluconokinase